MDFALPYNKFKTLKKMCDRQKYFLAGYHYQFTVKDYKLMVQYYLMAIDLAHSEAMCHLVYIIKQL